jgi:hypothetical protein
VKSPAYTISFAEVSTRSRGAIGLAARPGLSQDDVEELGGGRAA